MQIKQPKLQLEVGSIVKERGSERKMIVGRFKTIHMDYEKTAKQAFCIPCDFGDALDGKWYPTNVLTIVGKVETVKDA